MCNKIKTRNTKPYENLKQRLNPSARHCVDTIGEFRAVRAYTPSLLLWKMFLPSSPNSWRSSFGGGFGSAILKAAKHIHASGNSNGAGPVSNLSASTREIAKNILLRTVRARPVLLSILKRVFLHPNGANHTTQNTIRQKCMMRKMPTRTVCRQDSVRFEHLPEKHSHTNIYR